MTGTMNPPKVRRGLFGHESVKRQGLLEREHPVKLGRIILALVLAFFAGTMLTLSIQQLTAGDEITEAAQLDGAFPDSQIVTVRSGDTLDEIVQTTFPNTLVEGADDKDVERFHDEWERLIALRSGIAGGNIVAGDRIAIPVAGGTPGSFAPEQLPQELARQSGQ